MNSIAFESKILSNSRQTPVFIPTVCPIIFTNGCFDILHRGHLTYLYEAKQLGGILVVGINSDNSVKRLKGPTRPINNQYDRAFALAALSFVDFVFIYNENKAINAIQYVQPKKYVKGQDYTLETIDKEERKILELLKCQIHFLPFINGYSTTKIIQKINNA